MLIKILMVVAVLIAGILILAARKPDTFSVVRSIRIHGSAADIFAQLNDFSRWKAWSPWEKMDRTMQRNLSGADEGVGAKYEWIGNKKVGHGSMEITEAVPGQKLVIKLDFIRPFEAHNTTVFTLTREGQEVNLRWEMHGANLFMGKLMGIFMDMDKMVGKDFEECLLNLKKLVEAENKQ